jgi:hypothetical protein
MEELNKRTYKNHWILSTIGAFFLTAIVIPIATDVMFAVNQPPYPSIEEASIMGTIMALIVFATFVYGYKLTNYTFNNSKKRGIILLIALISVKTLVYFTIQSDHRADKKTSLISAPKEYKSNNDSTKIAVINNNTAMKELYNHCKANTEICFFYLAGIRQGYLSGYLKGHSSGAYITGQIAGKYIGESQIVESANLARELGKAKAEKGLECYPSISIDSIKEQFLNLVKNNPELIKNNDPDAIMMEISKIVTKLMDECINTKLE